jgi:hypothetical protein
MHSGQKNTTMTRFLGCLVLDVTRHPKFTGVDFPLKSMRYVLFGGGSAYSWWMDPLSSVNTGIQLVEGLHTSGGVSETCLGRCTF